MLNLKIHNRVHSTLVPILTRWVNPHPHILFPEINIRIRSQVLISQIIFLHDLCLCIVLCKIQGFNTPVF
jgi:hypothetical protein